MNFTINDVDQVIERTGCSYREAKEALAQANGDVVDAIIYLENRERSSFDSFFKGVSEETERTTDSIVNTIKAAIKEGNVTKIEVRNANGKKISPTVFSEDSHYMEAYTLNNIPKSAYGKTFTVTPYYTTQDGTIVDGATNAFTIANMIK